LDTDARLITNIEAPTIAKANINKSALFLVIFDRIEGFELFGFDFTERDDVFLVDGFLMGFLFIIISLFNDYYFNISISLKFKLSSIC